jgi:hypothetical protein
MAYPQFCLSWFWFPYRLPLMPWIIDLNGAENWPILLAIWMGWLQASANACMLYSCNCRRQGKTTNLQHALAVLATNPSI